MLKHQSKLFVSMDLSQGWQAMGHLRGKGTGDGILRESTKPGGSDRQQQC